MNDYVFNFHNIALLAAVVSGLVQPYISALLTRAPTWLTGVITSLQAAAAGFIAEAVAGGDHYDWRKALGTAFSAWLVGLAAQYGHLSGTKVQAKLHAVGTTAPKSAA